MRIQERMITMASKSILSTHYNCICALLCESVTLFLCLKILSVASLPQHSPSPQQKIMFEHSEPIQQNHHCREWEWMCEDGVECIAQYDVCDGVPQCADRSDERNCINRFPAKSYHHNSLPHNEPFHIQQAQTQQQKIAQEPTLNTRYTPKVSDAAAEVKELNMTYIFGGLSIFVFVAFITHALLKRHRRCQRLGEGGLRNGAFRKGESLVDDEDDLLISQMYS